MEEQEVFVLDELIMEVLKNNINPEVLHTILSVIQTLDNIDKLETFNFDIDLEEIEDDLMEIIEENDELPTVDIANHVVIKLKKEIIDTLEDIGIEVEDDITFKQLDLILTALYSIFCLDKGFVGEVLITLESNAGKKERMFELITRFADIRLTELIEIVKSVDEDLIYTLIDKFRNDILFTNKELNIDVRSKLTRLINTDPLFINTKSFTFVMEHGFSDIEYIYEIKDLKDVLSTGYEIYLLYFMLTDNVNILERYKEELHIENLETIGDATEKHEQLHFVIKELDDKVHNREVKHDAHRIL